MSAATRPTLRLTGAEALVRVLRASGVMDYIGVCGGNLAGILKSIAVLSGVKYMGCRHEAAGAFMAAGVFNSTGRVAACLAELGPGTVNLVGGLGMACNNNLPLLALTSSFPSRKTSPLIGSMMELDSTALTRAVTKWNTQVRNVERIPEIARWALREALTGRPGPVHLDLPSDVLAAEYDFPQDEIEAPLEHFLPTGRGHVSVSLARRAAEMLQAAKRPLLLAGGGAIHSRAVPRFLELRSRLGAAATCTQMAIGSIPTDSPWFIGHGGVLAGEPVVRALKEADVVLAVGCRFSSWLREDGHPITPGAPDQWIIHVDQDPTTPGRAQGVALSLIGDAQAVLEQILQHIARQSTDKPGSWLKELVGLQLARRRQLEELASDDTTPMHPARLARDFGALLPDDALVVYDGGHTTFWTIDMTPARHPGSRFNDSGMAQLGFGTPFAHGIKAVHPDRLVVNIVGDGSFGFTLQELDTARREKLNVVHLIHNNAAWGVIRAGQRRAGFEMGGNLEGTDYAAIARGSGCHGETITAAADIRPAFERAIASGLPAVLDARVAYHSYPNMPYFGASLR